MGPGGGPDPVDVGSGPRVEAGVEVRGGDRHVLDPDSRREKAVQGPPEALGGPAVRREVHRGDLSGGVDSGVRPARGHDPARLPADALQHRLELPLDRGYVGLELPTVEVASVVMHQEPETGQGVGGHGVGGRVVPRWARPAGAARGGRGAWPGRWATEVEPEAAAWTTTPGPARPASTPSSAGCASSPHSRGIEDGVNRPLGTAPVPSIPPRPTRPCPAPRPPAPLLSESSFAGFPTGRISAWTRPGARFVSSCGARRRPCSWAPS